MPQLRLHIPTTTSSRDFEIAAQLSGFAMTSRSYTSPHSCEHCEEIILIRPNDDLALHEDTSSGRPLLLFNLMCELPGVQKLIQDLQQMFLFEVTLDDLDRYVEEDCLFYEFIATGLGRYK
jgi:hypothetical protein